MLRHFFTALFLCCTAAAHAQHVGITPVKATEKQNDAAIDFKQTGAPMPALLLTTIYPSAAGDEQKHGNAKKEKDAAKPGGYIYGRKAIMSNADFDNGANLFVMMFNPTCAHCEDETKMLGHNMDKFRRSKVILMAKPLMAPYMPDFAKALHVFEHEPMYMGTDSTNFIDNVFLYQTLPQINIYDHSRRLIRTYNGEVSIDSLAKYIE